MKKEILSEIGAELKKRRIEMGLDLDFFAENLKIRKRYLRAIESGNGNILKFDAYTIGYIKNYAAALELDPTYYVNMITSNLKSGKLKSMSSENLITREEFLPSKKIIFLTVALLIVFYITIEIFS
jgi:cytoskeletal protein RodZ